MANDYSGPSTGALKRGPPTAQIHSKKKKQSRTSRRFKCPIRAGYQVVSGTLKPWGVPLSNCSRGIGFEHISDLKRHLDTGLHGNTKIDRCDQCFFYFVRLNFESHVCVPQDEDRLPEGQRKVWRALYRQFVSEGDIPDEYYDVRMPSSVTLELQHGSENESARSMQGISPWSQTIESAHSGPKDSLPTPPKETATPLGGSSETRWPDSQDTNSQLHDGDTQATNTRSPSAGVLPPISDQSAQGLYSNYDARSFIARTLLSHISLLSIPYTGKLVDFDSDVAHPRLWAASLITCPNLLCKSVEELAWPNVERLPPHPVGLAADQVSILRAFRFEVSELIEKFSRRVLRFRAEASALQNFADHIEVCEHSLCRLKFGSSISSSQLQSDIDVPTEQRGDSQRSWSQAQTGAPPNTAAGSADFVAHVGTFASLGSFTFSKASLERLKTDAQVNVRSQAFKEYLNDSENRCLTLRKRGGPKRSEGTFHCTWSCGNTFERFDDWKRHEEMNTPQELYWCSLCERGGDKPYVSYRHDKVREHVKQKHQPKGGPTKIDKCKISYSFPYDRGWGCGFCSAIFDSWRERMKHIGLHFKSGSTINDWHTRIAGNQGGHELDDDDATEVPSEGESAEHDHNDQGYASKVNTQPGPDESYALKVTLNLTSDVSDTVGDSRDSAYGSWNESGFLCSEE